MNKYRVYFIGYDIKKDPYFVDVEGGGLTLEPSCQFIVIGELLGDDRISHEHFFNAKEVLRIEKLSS